MSWFKSRDEVITKPELKELYQHITPQYASHWKVIGTLLGLPSGELKAIEAGYPTNVKWCCNQMLEKWLEVDPTASWQKLFTVIESTAVSSSLAVDKVTSSKCDLDTLTVTDTEADAVSTLSEMVSRYNVQGRFNTDEDTWPPDQPNNFTPLVLIHHQGQHSVKQATAMAQLARMGKIDEITSLASNESSPKHHCQQDSHEALQEALGSSMVTKELTEILVPLEQSTDAQFILIEGAPGIGKSVLLKEIAYRWGIKQLLKTFKLVLLISLRDPTIQQVSLVKDMLQLFCKKEDKKATQIVTSCTDYLVQNDGKDLALLFDSYDEYPEALHKNSFIADVLKRKLLPCCAIIISSRPHATVHLRKQATVRVDILGFTEIERNQFIQQTLAKQSQSIKELTQYLDDHFTISSLCLVPFNLVVLLFLYKQGISLPNNSTELYNHFICLTICRHLAKYGHTLDNSITDLTNLPDPCNKIIQQLSKFSLEALNNNKLVFTFDEIKLACPDIGVTPGAINGFGLLQALQHFDLTGKTMTFNFIHFTIQEFLAAHCVANLPPSDELKILKEKFWSDLHTGMFAIYITLTKGQRPSFKQFIKPSLGQQFKMLLIGEQVANRFVDDQLKCFRLFRCFFEAGDKEICRSIEDAKIFNSNTIRINDDAKYTRLSATDVECLTVFLTCSSRRNWEEVDLQCCCIQDHGVHMLHRGLKGCDLDIKALKLWFNGLTESSSSAISDIVISCRVKELHVSGNNTIGEDARLYSVISNPSSMLEVLYIGYTKLSSNAAIKLFNALNEGKKLKVLGINNNKITNEVCDAILAAMKKNDSLAELYMHGNPISGECMLLIAESLHHNSSLQQLWPPIEYSEDVKKRIRLIAKEVNKNRVNHECQVKLKIYC